MLFVTIALNSCSSAFDPATKSNDDKIFAFGRYQKNGDTYFIVEDDSKIVVLNNSAKADDDLNKRFFVAGKATQKTDGNGNSYWQMFVEIMEEAKIHYLTVVDSSRNINDFGTSGMFFERNMGYNHIYFSGKYLNFIYTVYSSSDDNHVFSFIYNSEKREYADNRMTIYVRHKDTNTENTDKRLYRMYSSLDVSHIFDLIDANRITLVINTINLEGEQEEDVFELVRN